MSDLISNTFHFVVGEKLGLFVNNALCAHIVGGGGGGGAELNLLLNFQKGGLGRTSVFRGGFLGKRGVNFLLGRWGGGCLQFLDNK